ncbi:MAG: hypothetical protein Q9M24_08970 [Mariprofundaceae bacterium]|nr:hypothetical protein [Mariprofundaceae bacterium]
MRKPDPVFLSQRIEASMRAMNGMRMILLGGDMGRLDKAMLVFHEAFEPVRQYLERFGTGNTTEEEMARLRQLEMMHHKVMRSIMKKMHNVQEDILVIENAQSRLHNTAAVVVGLS